MAKNKVDKSIKKAKKGISEFVDEAKETGKDAVEYIKDKTK